MNQGIEMLLARMDSHPEEFAFSFGHGAMDGRWAHVIGQIEMRIYPDPKSNVPPALPFLSDEEVRAVYDKFAQLQGDEFTRYVMRELLGDKDEAPVPAWTGLTTMKGPNITYATLWRV